MKLCNQCQTLNIEENLWIRDPVLNSMYDSFLHALQTWKKAGIVLILESIKDRKYWIRLITTIEYFNLSIDTWSIGNTSY